MQFCNSYGGDAESPGLDHKGVPYRNGEIAVTDAAVIIGRKPDNGRGYGHYHPGPPPKEPGKKDYRYEIKDEKTKLAGEVVEIADGNKKHDRQQQYQEFPGVFPVHHEIEGIFDFHNMGKVIQRRRSINQSFL